MSARTSLSRSRSRAKDCASCNCKPGALVSVVFRHVRLFENGRYTEGDVRHGRVVPADIA